MSENDFVDFIKSKMYKERKKTHCGSLIIKIVYILLLEINLVTYFKNSSIYLKLFFNFCNETP